MFKTRVFSIRINNVSLVLKSNYLSLRMVDKASKNCITLYLLKVKLYAIYTAYVCILKRNYAYWTNNSPQEP